MGRMRPLQLMSVAVLIAAVTCEAGAQDEELLLPDLIVRPSNLYDNAITTSLVPGRVHLRLSNGTGNIGAGPLHIRGVRPANDDGTQDVLQRVSRSDGSFVDLPAGRFVYHSEHSHIHVEDWAAYRLRELLPGDAVGEVLTSAEKTSFCILDLQVYDDSLPGFEETPVFLSCTSAVQGLSVGWLDLYDKTLPGQYIDITGVPPGTYWLESIVDPYDRFVETDEENNVARVKVTIPETGVLAPDPYEPNGSIGEVEWRPEGGNNSPNLGPVGPERIVQDLSVHERGDVDIFRFYSPAGGTADSYARISFDNRSGNLDLELLDAAGQFISRSATDGNGELLSLEGLPDGWYHVLVSGRDGDVNAEYTLAIRPPQNNPPAVEVLAPHEGDLRLLHGLDLFKVEWRAEDIDDNPTWVSVFLNTKKMLDGGEELLPSSRLTPGARGFHIINSADIEPGTYWIYCAVTDGGTVTGTWSSGTLTFLEVPESCITVGEESSGGQDIADCNGNSVLDSCDIGIGIERDCNENGVPDSCEIRAGFLPDADGDGEADRCDRPFRRGDINDDGRFDISDPIRLFGFLFAGRSPPPCAEAADSNNDGEVDITDAVVILSFLFGSETIAAPETLGASCGLDTDPPGSPRYLGCDAYDHCF